MFVRPVTVRDLWQSNFFVLLRGRMTAKEGPSSFTFVSANISWRFDRLDLKSCFEVHLAMYEVGCYWKRSKR
jgi:hypothetical protein